MIFIRHLFGFLFLHFPPAKGIYFAEYKKCLYSPAEE